MNNTNPENQHDPSPGYLVAGLLLGSLIGALVGAFVMMLLAPQSGKKTRTQIQRKSRDLRRQCGNMIESGAHQVRDKAQQVTTGIQDRAEDLQQRGHEVVDDQRKRWSPVVEAGQTAVNG